MGLSSISAKDLGDLAGRFDRPELIECGSVHILAFDAIRDRSGRKWPLHKENVRAFAERQFEKHFGNEDAFVPLDDINILLVQSSESGFRAQTRALKLLRTILDYFLGESSRADINIYRVTRIGSDGVESQRLEVSDVLWRQNADFAWDADAPSPAMRAFAEPAPSAGHAGPQLARIEGRTCAGPAISSDGRTHEAVFLTEPIWGVRQRAVVSYLLRPLIFERGPDSCVEADLSRASLSELTRINRLTMAEVERLFEEQGSERRFALHVPVHCASLCTITGRQNLLAALERLQPKAASSVVVVLKGLEVGAPPSRLLELTSLLAGRCRAVVALAPNTDARVGQWRGTKLSGLAIDFSDSARLQKSPTLRVLSEFTDQVKDVAPTLFAYSAATSSVLMAAWAAGFTHIGGDLVLNGRRGDFPTVRLDPVDLYRDRLSNSEWTSQAQY